MMSFCWRSSLRRLFKQRICQGGTMLKSSRLKHVSLLPEFCQDPFHLGVDEVIDVRTKEEFDEDHFPGAVNLPVLNSMQKHDVGLLYSRNSFEARKLGAQLICENISSHLSKHFNGKPKNYTSLVYCWRGGQRSQSLGIVLSQIGFQTSVLEGGYKTYRSIVRKHLSELPKLFHFNIISGLTGTGKTLLLKHLALKGEQVLDLEELANHRGSVLGLLPGNNQPSQKYFESLILEKLLQLDKSQPVWVESESRGIGKCFIPEDLFSQMKQAKKCYVINLPLEKRVQYIISYYNLWTTHSENLKDNLKFLTKHHGGEKIKEWCEMVDNREWEDLVRELLLCHYDLSYTVSQKRLLEKNVKCQTSVMDINDLSETSLADLVRTLQNDKCPELSECQGCLPELEPSFITQ